MCHWSNAEVDVQFVMNMLGAFLRNKLLLCGKQISLWPSEPGPKGKANSVPKLDHAEV